MTSPHNQQHTWTHTEAGTYLVRAVCASAPAVVHDDTQGRPRSRAVGNQSRGFHIQWRDCLFVHDDLPVVTGRGLRAPGPFHQFPNPLTGVSSPLVRAGRQAVERIPYRRSGLPFLRFKTTNYLARQSTNRSPATAHFQCVSFAAHNVAKERLNEVHSSHESGSPHDH